MAKRTKSALKANRQNVKRRESNRGLRTKLRTALKAIRASLDAKDVDGAKKALSATVSIVDKMATKGIIHRNTAGRYKARIASRLTKASAAEDGPAEAGPHVTGRLKPGPTSQARPKAASTRLAPAPVSRGRLEPARRPTQLHDQPLEQDPGISP